MDEEKPAAAKLADYFERGNYLLVALPEWLKDVIPLNASSLVREWELMLDPVRALRRAAEDLIGVEDWFVGNHYVVPGYETANWIRQAGADDGVAAAFSEAFGELRAADRRFALRHLAKGDDSTSGFKDEAQPVLFGLAVGAVVQTVTTTPGLLLAEKVDAARAARTDLQIGDLNPEHFTRPQD